MDVISYNLAANAHTKIDSTISDVALNKSQLDTNTSNLSTLSDTVTTNKENTDASLTDLQDKITEIESIAPTAEEFTAEADQTQFDLTYTVGLIDVYVNDVFINTSDYTADDGEKIVFNDALAEDDKVYVKKYVNFAEADGYSKAEVDEIVTTVDNRVTTEVETINNTLATKLDITGDGSKLTGVSPDIQNYVNAMATTSGGNVALTRTFTAVATDGQTEFFYTEPSKQNDTITITAANDFAYVVTINDVEYSYTSDADATIAEIQDGIIDAVTDDILGITASGDDLVVESNEVNISYTLSVGDNLSSINNTVATDGIKYIPESLTVTVEGIQIDSSDYVAGDGNKIVFNDGLSENSVVTLIAYGGADVYNKSQTNSILSEYATKESLSNLNPLTVNTKIVLEEDYTIPVGESRIVSSLDTNGHTLTVDGELMDISAMNAELLDEVRDEYDPQIATLTDDIETKQSIVQSSYTQIPDATLDTGTFTFDYSQGDMQQLTVTGDITLEFSNFVADRVCSMIIDLVGAGDYTLTLPDDLLFDSGTVPELTSGTDRLCVMKDADDVYSMFILGLDIKAA